MKAAMLAAVKRLRLLGMWEKRMFNDLSGFWEELFLWD